MVLPSFAGEFEDALKKNDNVLLYLYGTSCRYCTEFNPIYNKMSKLYDKKYAFVKVNTDGQYGRKLAREFKVRYVPYVVLVNSKTKNAAQIAPDCLMNRTCMDTALSKFKG